MNLYTRLHKFNAVERLSFVYGILTAVYILIFYGRIENPSNLLLNRLIFFAALLLVVFLSEKFRKTAIDFIRYLLPFALVAYWYPETYYLNHDVIIPNLDNFFDNLDKLLFSCSPAMEFSRILPQPAVSELMYFGYFSYFFTFLLLLTCTFFKRRELAGYVMFRILCSFFVFYVIFIFIPVSGPQFHYESPDNQVPDGYIFSSLMRWIQSSGEQPTGAFPSSHVGMTLISVWLIFKYFRRLFYFVLPIAIILIASTVYIKAHYLIDVVAAFILTPLIYTASKLMIND